MPEHSVAVDTVGPLAETAEAGLTIGPLTMKMSGPARIINRLEPRYRNFSTAAGPGDIKVAIEAEPGIFNGPLCPVTTAWSGDRLTASSYNFKLNYSPGFARVLIADDWRAADAAVRVLGSALLLERGVLTSHASAVVKGGEAYVFCGPSESGKTTLASMKTSGVGGSDELICLWPRGSRLTVLDTPFWNRQPPLGFKPAPARGLLFIRQDRVTYLRPIDPKQVVLDAWANAFFDPEEQRQSKLALKVCAALALVDAPAFHFHFRLDEAEVWRALDGI